MLSKICEQHEANILQKCVEFTQKIGVVDTFLLIVSLQHDGFMMLKHPKINKTFLDKLSDFIWEETGLRVKYKFKPLSI